MATDGIKIIDSDLAHDTYNMLMDYYDAGATLKQVEEKFPLTEEQGDDFETEIYAVACGLAYWEIGLMIPKRVEYIKKVVEKGAFTKIWVEDLQEPEKTKELKKRNAVINRYLKKISAENQKIRKRKKYSKIKNFHFQKGDIINVEVEKGKNIVAICYGIEQIRSKCYYVLFLTSGFNAEKYDQSKISQKPIIGKTIEGDTTGFGQALKGLPDSEYNRIIQEYQEKAQKSITQEFLNEIFEQIEEGNNKAVLRESLIDHKIITLNKDKFSKIASCEFLEDRIKPKTYYGYLSNMKDFEIWIEKKDLGFNYQLEYPIDLLCKIKPKMTIIK